MNALTVVCLKKNKFFKCLNVKCSKIIFISNKIKIKTKLLYSFVNKIRMSLNFLVIKILLSLFFFHKVKLYELKRKLNKIWYTHKIKLLSMLSILTGV